MQNVQTTAISFTYFFEDEDESYFGEDGVRAYFDGEPNGEDIDLFLLLDSLSSPGIYKEMHVCDCHRGGHPIGDIIVIHDDPRQLIAWSIDDTAPVEERSLHSIDAFIDERGIRHNGGKLLLFQRDHLLSAIEKLVDAILQCNEDVSAGIASGRYRCGDFELGDLLQKVAKCKEYRSAHAPKHE